MLDERGPMLLVAILGVLLAGHAYVPLDPLHPAARLRQVLGAAQPAIAIAGATFRSRLEETQYPFTALFDIETVAREAPATAAALADIRPGPAQLAYVIFTSGSTGAPKGAMIEHRGLLNHLFAKVDDLRLSDQDVIAQTASQCFDISVWQSLVTALVGGRTHLLPDAIAHDPKELLLAVERGGVTILEVVPSMLRALLDETEQRPDQHDLSRLRWLIATGEALPPDLCARWFEAHPEIPLLNAYGPTECSDDVTHFAMTSAPARTTPIGFAIRNTNLYVMSPDALLLPVGVAGELWVGGDGVGRGYIGEPARTADVFIPDPFSTSSGARLYRTGDLVRRRADGAIDFLGRIDHQVKLRGFRIELGEIETVLRSHSKVSDVAVVLREERRGDKRLVAYVVAQGLAGSELSAELSMHVRGALPEYMVPSTFVGLEVLPLTANGKLDRKALPSPEDPASMGSTYAVPRGPLEQTLAEIWAQVLGVPRVGIHDNFFELGGHSLLATQVVSRLRAALRREIPLRVLFDAPTVELLASALADDPRPRSGLLTRLATGTPGERPLFFVHGAGGSALVFAHLARHVGAASVYGISAPEGDALGMDLTMERLSALYVEAIRAVQPRGPYALGGWSLGGVIAFEMARQLERQGERVELLMLLDSYPPDADEPMPDEAGRLAAFSESLGVHWRELRVDIERVMQLSGVDRWAYVLECARSAAVELPPRRGRSLWSVSTCGSNAS